MKKFKTVLLRSLIIIFWFAASAPLSSAKHPRIYTDSSKKNEILAKIKNYSWADSLYKEFIAGVEVYANRHRTDPEWILSRYPLRWNRPYYTNFDDHWSSTVWINYRGDAPFPTIRVGEKGRSPLVDGYVIRSPRLETAIPFATNDKQWVPVPYPSGTVNIFTNSGGTLLSLQDEIHKVALDAALLWWLTGAEKYGRLAADITTLVMQAASYNSQVTGGPLYANSTLMNTTYSIHLLLAFDFIQPYLVANQGRYTNTLNTPSGSVSWVIGTNERQNIVCEKLAKMAIDWGLVGNNFELVEMPCIVFSALCHSDQEREKILMSYYTSVSGPGSTPLSRLMHLFDDNGAWYETPSYHNYPVMYLLPVAFAADRNGYETFRKFPPIMKSTYALAYLTYPNGVCPGFGDGGRMGNYPQFVDLVLSAAVEQGLPDKDIMSTVLNDAIAAGYNRGTMGGEARFHSVMRLVAGMPKIPTSTVVVEKPRSQIFTPQKITNTVIQRNGNHREHGMMFQVSGSAHGHSHRHGPALEFFARGLILGTDYGQASQVYETLKGRGFYRQWASHNTVMVKAQSSTEGRGMWDQANPVYFPAYEPTPNAIPLSDMFSWVDSTFYDATPGNNADQRRSTWLIRLTPTTGVFFDIYRSQCRPETAAGQFHDYLYHNISTSVVLNGRNGSALPVSQVENTVLNPLPDTWENGPGYSFFSNVYTTGIITNEVTADFVLPLTTGAIHMRATVNPGNGRQYFSARTQPSFMDTWESRGKIPNALVVRKTGEAWETPFAVVFAPSRESDRVVKNIQWAGSAAGGADPAIITFESIDPDGASGADIVKVLSASNIYGFHSNQNLVFQGLAAAVVTNATEGLKSLYLAKGRKLGWKGTVIESIGRTPAGACLDFLSGRATLKTTGNTRVTLRYNNTTMTNYSDLRLCYFRQGKLNVCENAVANSDLGVTSIGWGTLAGSVPAGSPAELRVLTKSQTELLDEDGRSYCTVFVNGAPLAKGSLIPRDSSISIVVVNKTGFADNGLSFSVNYQKVDETVIVPVKIGATSREYSLGTISGSSHLQVTAESIAGAVQNFNFILKIGQNCSAYPNPANRREIAEISVSLPAKEQSPAPVLITLDGRVLRTFNQTTIISGTANFLWDLCDSAGEKVSAGIYFIVTPDNPGSVVKIIVE